MKTSDGLALPPDVPQFGWDRLPSDNGLAKIKVTWYPNKEGGKPGSHFFVKHRIKGESQWVFTDPEIIDDTTVVRGLQPDTNYEFRVVSVDGSFHTESGSQDVDTYGTGEAERESDHLFYPYDTDADCSSQRVQSKCPVRMWRPPAGL